MNLYLYVLIGGIVVAACVYIGVKKGWLPE